MKNCLLPMAIGLTVIGLASPLSAMSLGNYASSGPTIQIRTNEASAVTFNRDTGTLYTVGDEGRFIYNHTTSGVELFNNLMGLGSFQDVEGICYLGNGQFMLAEERNQKGFEFTYINAPTAGTDSGSAIPYTFGSPVGNIGLEGVSYDHLTNSVWGVKEKTNQAVYQMTDFRNTNAVNNPFDPTSLGLADLSDIYMLSNSLAFVGTDREWNLLILSQESRRLVEVTRTGMLVGSLDLAFLGAGSESIEGVTMDDIGNLYLVGEGLGSSSPSNLFILTAVPEPREFAIAIAALLGMVAFFRHRTRFSRPLN